MIFGLALLWFLSVFIPAHFIRRRIEAAPEKSPNAGQWVGLVGSGLLFLGAFMPVVRMPIVGSINYVNNGEGDGVFIVAVAVIAMVSALAGWGLLLGTMGLVSAALMTYSVISFLGLRSESVADLQEELVDNPFAGLGEAMIQSVQLEWGWGVLFLGAAFVMTGGIALVLRTRPTKGP